MKDRRTEHGVSLIELLVALAILAIALVPLLSVFTHAVRTGEHAHKRTVAMNLARDLQEEIRAKAFSEEDKADIPAISSGTSYYPNGTTAQPFGFEEGSYDTSKSRWEQYDDVDDYDGWCRGKDCGGTPLPLEAYDGTKYEGAGFPRYYDFTRSVEIYNIYPNLSTEPGTGENRKGEEPYQHRMIVGGEEKTFDFYDLRDDTLTTLVAPDGRTRLKVIKVTVTYTGAVTPPLGVEDIGLAVLPIREE